MKKKGFTLIELLAVIAILAILVLLVVPNVMKLFNKSKKEAFEIQVRKTAKTMDSDLELDAESLEIMDCKQVLEGDMFDSCEAQFINGKPYINAVGKGKYSHFMMVDATIDSDSGVVINLEELQEFPSDSDKLTSDFINKSENKLNKNIFVEQKPEDIIDKIKAYDFIDQEQKDYLDDVRMVFTEGIDGDKIYLSPIITEGKLFGGDGDINYLIDDEIPDPIPPNGIGLPIYIVKFNLGYNGGNYNIKSVGHSGEYLYFIISGKEYKEMLKNQMNEYYEPSKEDILNLFVVSNNSNVNPQLPFIYGNYTYDDDYDKYEVDASNIDVTLENNKDYYIVFILQDLNGKQDTTSILNQVTFTNEGKKFGLNGNADVLLLKNEVDKYVDAGVSSSVKIKENKHYVVHNNLKNEIGDYKYNYYIKRNGEIEKITRNIYVVSEKYDKYLAVGRYGAYLLEDTDKYKFYCGSTKSEMKNGDVCFGPCHGNSYIKIKSTETSYTELILLPGGNCLE